MWLNINWGNPQPLTVTGFSELSAFLIVPGSWRLQFCPIVRYYDVTWCTSVDCSVVIILAEYVLCLQFKNAVDNFPMEQGSWKADIRLSSQEIPSCNGKWTFISELKSACHWGPLYTVPFLFFYSLRVMHLTVANVTVVGAANFHLI